MSAPLGDARFDQVAERIARFIADGEIAGAGLALAVGGEPSLEWYGGQARPDLPAGPAVLWPIASITKLLTAAACLALVERGELTLATPVHRVLPAFAGDGREAVLLRHLLTHTAGLIDHPPNYQAHLLAQAPLETMLAGAYTEPLLFAPGTHFRYSDCGYALAGLLVAAVTGHTLGEALRLLVLEPTGLHDTFLPTPESEHQRTAYVTGSYAEGTPGAMYNSRYALLQENGAASAVASVPDMLRFALLFAPSRPASIFSDATVRVMTTDQTGGHVTGDPDYADVGIPRPWGVGFMVRGHGYGSGDLVSPRAFGHIGASGCIVLVDPDLDLVVVYVSNTSMGRDPVRWRYRTDNVLNGSVAALTGGGKRWSVPA